MTTNFGENFNEIVQTTIATVVGVETTLYIDTLVDSGAKGAFVELYVDTSLFDANDTWAIYEYIKFSSGDSYRKVNTIQYGGSADVLYSKVRYHKYGAKWTVLHIGGTAKNLYIHGFRGEFA